jgi:hypothetical protein
VRFLRHPLPQMRALGITDLDPPNPATRRAS